MTEEEIVYYRVALRDFKTGDISVRSGFCNYFKTILNLNIDGERFKEKLPTLYSLKPNHNSTIWFPTDDLRSRIELLKKIIKDYEGS